MYIRLPTLLIDEQLHTIWFIGDVNVLRFKNIDYVIDCELKCHVMRGKR